MAKNLTNRVTLATVTVKGFPLQRYTFLTKEAQEQFLYGIAVANWPKKTQIPGTRKGCMEKFYGSMGNSYKCETVTQVSNEAATRANQAASTQVSRQKNSGERLVGSR